MLVPIPGYEGAYSASDNGRIFSHHKNDFLLEAKHKDVLYFHVSLWKMNQGRSFYVHRLIAEAFVSNPGNLPEVNHKNGMRGDNLPSNLEWVTSQENKIHAIETGLRVYTNRLTSAELEVCLADVINGENYASLSSRVPYKVPFLSVLIRRKARELGMEDQLDVSLQSQKSERARRTNASIRV